MEKEVTDESVLVGDTPGPVSVELMAQWLRFADGGSSANVIAAYYHDHVFVQSEDAERVAVRLSSLRDLR